MRKGVTVIEIVVVVAIILIMIALLIPAINQARNPPEISTVDYAKLSDLCSKNEIIKQRTKFFMQDGKINYAEYRELMKLNESGRYILSESLKGN